MSRSWQITCVTVPISSMRLQGFRAGELKRTLTGRLNHGRTQQDHRRGRCNLAPTGSSFDLRARAGRAGTVRDEGDVPLTRQDDEWPTAGPLLELHTCYTAESKGTPWASCFAPPLLVMRPSVPTRPSTRPFSAEFELPDGPLPLASRTQG